MGTTSRARRSISRSIAGTIRVAAPGSVSRELVIPVAARVSREFPELRVLMRESDDGVLV
jgi:DNA-binding transcriptional LysR family regulator